LDRERVVKTAPTTEITIHLASGTPVDWTALQKTLGIQKSMRHKLLNDVEEASGADLPTNAKGARRCTTALHDLMAAAQAASKADKALSFQAAVQRRLTEQGFEVPHKPIPMTQQELSIDHMTFQEEYSRKLEGMIARLDRLENIQNQNASRIAVLEGFQLHVEELIAAEDAAEPASPAAPAETSEPVYPAAIALGWLITAAEWVWYGVQWLGRWMVNVVRWLLGGWRRS
jgi:hypothetical protein